MSTATKSGRIWLIPGLPRKGWECIKVADLNPDEEPMEDIDYETCDVCGQHPIRFVHTIVHDEWPEPVDVGRTCVEHLTEDYINPERRERDLKNQAKARKDWLKKRWRVSAKGAWWLKEKGHRITVFRSTFTDGWKCSVDGQFGTLTHPTKEDVMLSAFNKYRAVAAMEASAP